MVAVAAAEGGAERRPRKSDLMMPDKSKRKKKRWAVYDIESRELDTDKPGFERPFLVCFYDGVDDYHFFRNDERHKGKSWETRFFLEPGGCIDKLMRHILGLGPCDECEIGPEDYKWGTCKACTRRRKRYQARKFQIAAHNGGNFDNLFVMGWIRRHRELFTGEEIVNVQSRMLILSFKPKSDRERGFEPAHHEKWQLTDSIALLPLSLKEVGETFCPENKDVQKMDMDMDLPEEDPRWEAYNKRDCLVLYTALNKFKRLVETQFKGSVGVTAASTAMSVLRRNFQKKPIPRNSHFPDCDGKCHDEHCPIEECRGKLPEERECHGCMHAFVREAFFGGRTEIFRMTSTVDVLDFGGRVKRKKKIRLIYMDINSSYPKSMLGLMPIGKSRVLKEGVSLSSLRAMGARHQGFVECIIEVPSSMYLPPLPYRWHKRTGEMKLIFPTGRLYGTWTWAEIEYALSLGCKILVVGKSVWFQTGYLFKEMIETLYSYRIKKCGECGKDQSKNECKCANPKPRRWNKGMDYVAKLMMNSCFGKFATNPIREKIVFLNEPFGEQQIPEGAKVSPSWRKDDDYLRRQHILNADYIIPHIAAVITSDARIRLHKGLMTVLKKPNGIIAYSDTDSGMVSHKMEPEGGKLGEWKVEYKNFDYEGLLPKSYKHTLHKDGCEDMTCAGCKMTHRKIKKGTKNVCADNELCVGCIPHKKVAMKGIPKGSQTGDTYDHLAAGGEVKFKRVTKFRTMLQKKVLSPYQEGAERRFKSAYDKRVVLPDGDTRPLHINDPFTLGEARSLRARLVRSVPTEEKRPVTEKDLMAIAEKNRQQGEILPWETVSLE